MVTCTTFKKHFFVLGSALVGAALSLALNACSTPQSKALRHVEVGMTKSDVLEIVGDPARTGREHGQDRWAYVNYEGKANSTIYVFFDDGHVTYVGPEDEPTDLPTHVEGVTASPQKQAAPSADEKFKPVGE
jgi:outer membrane protein assembly factor BamE (lipoprotein component of BamABCDE complex)